MTTETNSIITGVDDFSGASGSADVGFIASGTGAVARTVQSKARDIVSVRDISGFNGNGSGDDTAAIQQCADNGVSAWLPDDITSIRLTSTVNITKPMAFYGAGCSPFTSINEAAANVRGPGPWFHIDHTGKGFFIDPAADAMAVVRFQGCGTFRNQPTPGAGAFTPTANDWDMEANNCEVQLEDFVFLNPTKAFNANDLSRGGRLRLNNVRGQPLTNGISIDKCYDLAYLDVHWWPYWSLNTNVRAWTLANLRALWTGRVDGLFLHRYFTIYHNVGWLVDDFGSGTANRAHVDWAYLDLGMNGITFSASVGTNNTIGAAVITPATTLTLSAATVGTGRTATAGSATFAETDLGREIRSGAGRAFITGYTSTTVVTVTVLVALSSTSIASGDWTVVRPNGATINAAELTVFGQAVAGSSGILVSGAGSKITVGFLDCEAFFNQAIYLSGAGNRVQVGRSRFKNYGLFSGATPGVIVEGTNTIILESEPEDLKNTTQPLISNAGTASINQVRKGTVTLPGGNTSISVTGQNFLLGPTNQQITVGFGGSPLLTSKLWPSGGSLTGFVINADAAPGGPVTLTWRVDLS